jgi:hypothetical protein
VSLLILLGTAQFGLTLNQFVTLTNAASIGALQFALSRSDTTLYTDAVNAVKSAASSLTPASLTITMSANGTGCSTDAACATALTSNVGQPAQVMATYPCNLQACDTILRGVATFHHTFTEPRTIRRLIRPQTASK